jgi:Putative Actinobacterial Holin-X, holin superfamily III
MPAPQMQRSVPEVLQDIIGNIEEIIRSEFRLAKTELSEKASDAAQSAKTFGVGLFLGFYGLGFLLASRRLCLGRHYVHLARRIDRRRSSQKVKQAVDWRPVRAAPRYLDRSRLRYGIVLSALLPNRHSRHRSRDSYDDDSRRNNRIQRRLAQERIAQERVAQENMAQENVTYRNPAVSSESDIASSFARSSTSHDEKRGDSRNNFAALAGALAALAVASVARVIDSVLPGFQHEFTRAKTGPFVENTVRSEDIAKSQKARRGFSLRAFAVCGRAGLTDRT